MNGQLELFEELMSPPVPPMLGPAVVSVREHSSVLAKGGAQYLGCDYTLNPYVGCGFGCSYCYAAFFVADEQRREDWGRWVDVKGDAERQIARADLRGAKILMSSATDPYQPLEAKVELTRRLVELMSEPKRQPLLRVQTRSPLAARDIDLFKRFDSIRVNISITTDCDEIRKRFEPSCASIDRRFEALAQISAAGIPIGVSICPTLPMRDPESFARRVAALNPGHVFTGMFHQARREFTAGTRQGGLDLAKEYGWDQREYEKTVGILRRYLPGLRGIEGAILECADLAALGTARPGARGVTGKFSVQSTASRPCESQPVDPRARFWLHARLVGLTFSAARSAHSKGVCLHRYKQVTKCLTVPAWRSTPCSDRLTTCLCISPKGRACRCRRIGPRSSA